MPGKEKKVPNPLPRPVCQVKYIQLYLAHSGPCWLGMWLQLSRATTSDDGVCVCHFLPNPGANVGCGHGLGQDRCGAHEFGCPGAAGVWHELGNKPVLDLPTARKAWCRERRLIEQRRQRCSLR